MPVARDAMGPAVVRITRSPLARWSALAMLVALGGLFLTHTYDRMAKPSGNDLTVYLMSGRLLLQGGDPYAINMPQGHAPYPLTIDVLLIPLTWVPMWLAQTLWFGASGAFLVGSLVLLERLWRRTETSGNPVLAVPFVVRLATVTLALVVPLRNHLRYGQMDLLVLLCCCSFLVAHVGGRRWVASMSLGGAIALKLTPAIFLAPLLRERRLRTIWLTAGWLLLWGVGLPALASDQVLTLYRHSWVRRLNEQIAGPVSFGRRSRFTLAAALVELWPRVATVPGLRYWATAAVLTPIMLLPSRVARHPQGRLLMFSACLAAIPLVSPMSETHHLTLLFGALWVWLLAAGSRPGMPVLDGIGATLFLVCHWLGLALAGRATARRGSVFDCAALLVLYAIMLARGLRAPGGQRVPAPAAVQREPGAGATAS